jgi:hypothetical protein
MVENYESRVARKAEILAKEQRTQQQISSFNRIKNLRPQSSEKPKPIGTLMREI